MRLLERNASLRAEMQSLRETKLAELQEELDRRRQENEHELDAERTRVAEETEQLRALRHEIASDRSRLDDERFEAELERERIATERTRIEQRVEHGIATARGELEGRLALAAADRDAAHRRIDQLQERVDEAARHALAFGGRDPSDISDELERLRSQCVTLEADLSRARNGATRDELTAVRTENTGLREQNGDLIRKQGELRAVLERQRTDVNERETMALRVQAAERHRDVLTQEVERLSAKYDELLVKDRDQVPFARLAAIDDDADAKRKPVKQTGGPVELATLVSELRDRMATDKRVYYSIRDLRIFIAGLSASQLHLLEGISGTGKTTLPIVAASALGGQCTVVEVQAGWRDREDLLGHYNTFEGRYAETPFIEALYRAQMPAYKDAPYFVVLDEMNLSHPEQYFADLLSLLERDDEHSLLLTTQPLRTVPELLTPDAKLRVPPNVWFIGTANHDETTTLFADKTYDRSHVMTLPAKPERFDPRPTDRWTPVTHSALTAAFDRAADTHAKAHQNAWTFLDRSLRTTLNSEFDVGWGPRLEQQMSRFVPAVIATGGDAGEATDHILATKLLRKVRDRHDIKADQLRELEQEITSAWRSLDGASTSPEKSVALLRRERRRKGDTRD